MACSTRGFTRDTFHSTSISEESKCVVVDQFIPGLVKHRASVSLSDGQTNGIGEALTKWPGSNFNARSILSFGMARSYAVNCLHHEVQQCRHRLASLLVNCREAYSEGFKIVHRDLVAEEMEKSIL